MVVNPTHSATTGLYSSSSFMTSVLLSFRIRAAILAIAQRDVYAYHAMPTFEDGGNGVISTGLWLTCDLRFS